MATLQEKFEAWNKNLKEALEDFYSDVLDPLPKVYVEKSGEPNYTNAQILVSQLSGIKLIFEQTRKTIDDEEYSLAEENWPENNSIDLDGAATTLVSIIDNLISLQSNQLYSQLGQSWEEDLFLPGDRLPSDFGELVDAVIDNSSEFLSLFPDISVSLKKDIQPLPETQGLGPTPIFSDTNLEKTLTFSTDQTHYIGFLLNSEKSDGNRSNPYLPVRLSPAKETLELSWDDEGYSIIDNDGDLVKTKNKEIDGIEVPLGLEITITEIVSSKTGVWVGFVSDGLDGDHTDDQNRILYTRASYIRIKESAMRLNPDPYISELDSSFFDDPRRQARPHPGTQPVYPMMNENWVSLEQDDVRLVYYHFDDHNVKIVGKGDQDSLFYNKDTITAAPTLRYSDGYYYFILGSKPRKSEAELINEGLNEDTEGASSVYSESLESAKHAANAQTEESIKRDAWNNLLNYLGKNTVGGNTNLYEALYEKYFVVVGKKLNTNSTNPNNQKLLFAIRAAYVDSLPEVRRPYTQDFEPGSPFLDGREYAVSLTMSEVKERCKYLSEEVLAPLKASIAKNNATVENANDLKYDLDAQIDSMNSFPALIDDFLRRQSFPASMNQSLIYDMVNQSIETESDHIIQIGIRDNGLIGGDVRETISYMLFSPDPDSLKDSSIKDSNLFYFDPYLSTDEITNKQEMKRSAISLRVALPYLRNNLEGLYNSRTLHLFLSYDKIKKKLGAGPTELQQKWMDFMHAYVVPPVKIYPSKNPSLIDPETLECDEIIELLSKSGPSVTLEERKLQEKLYSNPSCKAQYFEKFNDDTSATSPDLTKRELEEKSESFAEGGSIMGDAYVRLLYTQFFNILDTDAIIAMIMACIQKKLGLEITAEAICEAAIIELIESTDISSVEKIMLSNALLDPDSDASKVFLSQYTGMPTESYIQPNVQEEGISNATNYLLDSSFSDAPIAAALLLMDAPEGIEEQKKHMSMINAIKALEKSGVHIELSAGLRPEEMRNTYISIPAPPNDSTVVYNNDSTQIYVGNFYTETEIEREKMRLSELGYSASESRALLVTSGFLVPNERQYQSHKGTNEFVSQQQMGVTYNSTVVSSETGIRFRTTSTLAQNWFDYAKNTIGLAAMCELLVGSALEGLKDLIRDPGTFLSGGAEGWWEDFVDSLKKQFTLPPMTMSFPDSLRTDNHLGDYGEQLTKTFLSLVGSILGQIVNLLIKNALEQCLEEGGDTASSYNPAKLLPEEIPLPVIERSNLPRLRDQAGNSVSEETVVDWMKDIIDNLSTAQLCALLRGDATKATLKECLSRTKHNWEEIYSAGVDTIYEIRIAFEQIGKDIDLEICNVVSSPSDTFIDDLCNASYDRDARCLELTGAGLTEEECQIQIDQEIQNLREKVIGLANIGMFDSNPLSNSMPQMCGPNGNFIIPPGVEETMSRVTDSMLTNLKGSLIDDMTNLKFFSTPPRALLAMSDPDELENAHKMFTESIRSPYKKRCLALIGDPAYHDFRYEFSHLHPLFPITYNRYIHYGNFSTRAAEVENIEFDLEGLTEEQLSQGQKIYKTAYRNKIDELEKNYKFEVQEQLNNLEKKCISGCPGTPGYIIGLEAVYDEELFERQQNFLLAVIDLLSEPGSLLSAPGYQELFSDIEDVQDIAWDILAQITQFDSDAHQHAEESKQQFYNDLLNSAEFIAKSSISDDIADSFIFSDETIREHNIDYYNNVAGIYHSNDFFEGDDLLPMNTSLFFPKSDLENATIVTDFVGVATDNDEGLREYFTNALNNTSFSRDAINEQTIQEYKNQIKPIILDRLTIDYEQIIARPIYRTRKNFLLEDLEIGNSYGTFPGNVTERNYKSVHTPNLSEIHSLHTKLKDIDSDPMSWNVMLRNYTGCNIGDGATSETSTFPALWLSQPGPDTESIFDSMDLDDPNAFFEIFENIFTDKIYNPSAAEQPLSTFWKDHANHNRHWFNWMKISPGLRKLVKIMSDEVYACSQDPDKEYVAEFNVQRAFMELTVGEALGLSYERVRKLFPNMQDVISTSLGVMFGLDHHVYTNVLPVIKELGTEDTLSVDLTKTLGFTSLKCYYPHFIVFEKQFRDPKSILNADPDKMLEHFSLNEEKVNKELYEDFFDVLPMSLGGSLATSDQAKAIESEAAELEMQPNFNPNILKYDLPFTEISARSAGPFNGQSVSSEIVDLFTNPNAGERINALSTQLETLNLERSLVNQNVNTPISDNAITQFESIKNSSATIKAAIRNLPNNAESPPNVIPNNSSLAKEVYNYNFGHNLGKKSKDLLDNIYSGATSKRLLDIYSLEYSDLNIEDVKPHESVPNSIYSLHQHNYKAQAFGEFLTYKFFEKFDDYYDPTLLDSQEKSYVDNNIEQFRKNLKYSLSTYGYSGLQYAYSTQMMTKMKHSRLHQRGFMKKLWKKVLKSPITSDSVDPRCGQLFDLLNAPSKQELDKTTTDFFRLDQVKPRIIEFYKKSLCRDVYEENSPDENATRMSLLEGMTILVTKVYTLEMCLASVISWDSLDLEDVFKDDLAVSIIVDNISQDFDIEFLSHLANNIVKKDNDLTEAEMAAMRIKESSIEYLIRKEAGNISQIVKELFTNSSPLSTNLQLNILKNSDPDFIETYKLEVIDDKDKYPANAYAALHSDKGIEYVASAKMDNNIYTMNYGDPNKRSYYFADHDDHSAKENSDIFGFSTGNKGNKNYLHSLPMNFHSDALDDVDVTHTYHEDIGSTSSDYTNTRWNQNELPAYGATGAPFSNNIKKSIRAQRDILGFSDAFSLENNQGSCFGNNLNAKLGNVLFQPYVRIVDYNIDEKRDYSVNIYSEVTATGEPCEGATIVASYKVEDFLSDIQEELFEGRISNIFNCHMYDYVPLSAWSYYYNNVFMNYINNYDVSGQKPLLLLYKRYGLKPFFKNISFGMRMTYSTSYPIDGDPYSNEPDEDGIYKHKDNFSKFMNQAFVRKNEGALKNSKCLLGARGYYIHSKDHTSVSWQRKILRELQIPLVEVEREIKFHENFETFTVGSSDSFPLSALGNYVEPTIPHDAGMHEFIKPENDQYLDSLANNHHQFFYKNLANSMLTEIKNSAEFELMYEYFFPMKRYMALSFVVASDSLSKFIPEPTDVLDKTKNTLKTIIDGIANSVDYNFVPAATAAALANRLKFTEVGTSGQEPDLSKEIVKIIYRTSLLILKGFVEITDPAIITAKNIINISNMITTTTIEIIKKGVATAKQTVQSGIDAAKQALAQMEVQLGLSVGTLSTLAETLPKVEDTYLSQYTSIEASGPIADEMTGELLWSLQAEALPDDIKDNMTEEQIDTWDSFKKQLSDAEVLLEEYSSTYKQLNSLEEEKKNIEEESEAKLAEASELMKDVFSSPYMLPGIWASMLPSMIPFGGGLVPPPFFAGPPSTVPGMIYLALLLIDAYEEKLHDMQNTDPDCEDQL